MRFICNSLVALLTLLCSHSSVAYERAISLAPHITELIYAIGAQDKLIATVKSSDYPPAAKQLPRVGDGISVSAERLLALNPDVIFAWQPTRALQALESTLKSSQIALHYINPLTVDQIGTAALDLGHWLNSTETAQQFNQHWQQRLHQLEQRYYNPQPKTVFIVLNSQPLHSINDSLSQDVLRICGAQNWAQHSPTVAPAIHLEQLLATPFSDLVYSQNDEALEQLIERLERAYTRPVRTHQVQADHFYRAGPRLLEATAQLCAQLEAQAEKRVFSTKGD